MFWAIFFSTSVKVLVGRVGKSSDTSTILQISETFIKQSPNARGIFSFTSAITHLAVSAAAFVATVSTPRDKYPCSSGGDV